MTAATAEKPVPAKKAVTVRDLKDEFLDCRDLRHAWGKASDWGITRNTSGRIIEFTRVVVCRKCKTERHEKFSVPSMEVVNRRYLYPEGFLMPGSGFGTTHTKTQAVRREMLLRLLPKREELE